MAKQINKPQPPRRRRPGPNRAYWVVFALSSIVSFAAGFYVTYHGTRVAVKEPPIATDLASPVPQAIVVTPAPMLDSSASAEPVPVDPFAVGSEATPSPFEEPGADMAMEDGAMTAASPTPLKEESGTFRVQVGSYDSQASAQSMVDELSAAGVHAVVVQDSAGQYHAQIGAYTKRDRALSVADEVNAKGYSVTIRQ